MAVALLLGAAPVLAQTATSSATPAATGTHTPAHATKKKVPAKKAKAIPKAAPKKPPVVAPAHGVTPRHKAHEAVQPAAPKPAPKPVAKAAPKPAAPARPQIPADEGTVTHLHLPRFASLKTDDVNMRSGPGARYPVAWVYKRRELPVKIEREFDIWRLVEDMDGIQGWVHQATLTGKRTFVITGTEPRTMHAQADTASDPVAVLKPGVVGIIRICDANAAWCQVQTGGYRGWLQRSDFWGTLPGEAVAP